MTKEEFANLINGRQYRNELTKEESELAKELGFFIFYGASDDLLEVRGLEEDEYGAWEGCTVYINPDKTITKVPEDPRSVKIQAHWSPEDIDTSWVITASCESSQFDINEDDELYCRGIVIDSKDILLDE